MDVLAVTYDETGTITGANIIYDAETVNSVPGVLQVPLVDVPAEYNRVADGKLVQSIANP